MTRVLPAVGATNMRDALNRILSSMSGGWKAKPSKEDWAVYAEAIKIREEFKDKS